MVARKRARHELESPEPAPEPSMLDRIRNMWEFANLMQYIFFFGKVVKIDEDFDIEQLEQECLKPEHSEKLTEVGLALLKFVSSHRGLTSELFDEYTRRQYKAKAPSRNPFGEEEVPARFADFDIFSKLRVLHQLSQWTLINSERIREKMPEVKDTEQTQWRIEELGYDKQERLYFVLDDNRLYRRTDPPPPPPPAPKPKANSKKGKAAARASKRRKLSGPPPENDVDGTEEDFAGVREVPADDGFGGRKWECLAITLDQYKEFMETIRKSKDPMEKDLYKRLVDEVLPIIEKREEAQQRKAARREKELLNLEKLATAKRSSRIATKLDKQKEQQEAAEAERRRHAELINAWKDQERQKKMEEARETRMMTREQRLKEREYKRILHEEELANLSEDSKKLETGEARISARHLEAQVAKRKQQLEKLAQEDEWVFDCSVCGVYGDNLDDGSHSIACEKCNVWQHSSCLGVSQEAAERDDFHFLCTDCKRRMEDAKKPKIPSLKFRIGPSTSPPTNAAPRPDDSTAPKKRKQENNLISPSKKAKTSQNGSFEPSKQHGSQTMTTYHPISTMSVMHKPDLSPNGQSSRLYGAVNGHTNGVSTATLAYPSSTQPQQVGLTSNIEVHIPFMKHTASHQQPSNGSLPFGGPHGHSQDHQPSQQAQSTTKTPVLQSLKIPHSPPPQSVQAIPSPRKNSPTPSPTQSPRNIAPLTFPSAGSPNGLSQPQAQAKLPSPAKSSSPLTVNHQSSPSIIPPPISGISPVKNPQARTTNDQILNETPIIPPVALSPSPRQQNLSPPTKVLTFVQTHVNGR